ncbi:MAG: ATP-binding cassette domain-containing protein [Candidatus Obscuribacter sp.]|jgi:phospholipid/cholesterol/gamma-HCH transport system ATP-binding protein|nr:ATP-binding cassette domain-containing protein [Candidatus Obscuribacter sp.]MDQ5965802.1 Sulfate/thiosulfate import ATP-binding protein CysA [Cyanobacteriota bacterium erpe_2018_sw_39hr_WHONDRS-SW48-000098_B_bin.30]MBK7841396.1 ATP-binding cassette domain-containing protein [Candidatus Obscuribacter sp.]MBK9622249.1 ATP-binding cassette domain-containing protein [Candidatus Obscuribacter sp.]MBK9774416.1 ATP-binding cassette domain-containing protein [Candidatus Obscuribacter sp.]
MAARSAEPILELVNIHKAFGDRQILKGVSFQVFAGEMLGLIGPSGCGKSTILKIICGLLEPDQGEVIKRSDDIGLVFQGSALLNSLTVRENLAIALQARKLSRKESDRIISERLKMVGLEGFEEFSPTKLSGGQQKRTSFARAIVNDPKIILYDEPTTGLDPVMSTVIEDYMIDLERSLQAASIVVTHQHSTWTRTADRVLLMHAGKIVWEGTPEEGVTSEDPYMKQFAHATREGPMLVGAVED